MKENKLETITNLFENSTIRSIWDSEKEEYYFSVIDIIGALTDNNYQKARNYWKWLKNKLNNEGSELVSNTNQLKMKSTDGKYYYTDTLDTKGIFRLIESAPSSKAEPMKIWLALDQMSELFDRDKSVISRHIKKALTEELEKEVVVAKIATTTQHGAIEGKTQTHLVDYYNLDVIISVGYRVRSKNGIVFRKWANKVLKDCLIKGYAANNKRLEYLEKTIKLINITGRIDTELKGAEAQEIIKVINNYSNALTLLDDYDHNRISKPNGTTNNNKITYEGCMDIVCKLKFNSDSDLFALERDKGLQAIIGAIYQSFDGQDLYPTVEEKAANFLYLITKNHIFIDGNKRIAATLFIYFLEFYNLLYNENGKVIDNNTLVAITLLIAQSNPKEKNVLIDLVMNFFNNNINE